MVWGRIQLHSFAFGYLIVPAPFVEKPLFSPLNSVVENQLTIDVWVYFCTLNSIPLIYRSILIPVPHSFDYCSIVSSFRNGEAWLLQLFFLFSRLFWLFGVSYNSIWVLGSAFPFLPKKEKSLGFWFEYIESINHFGEYWHFNNNESFNSCLQDVFPFT